MLLRVLSDSLFSTKSHIVVLIKIQCFWQNSRSVEFLTKSHMVLWILNKSNLTLWVLKKAQVLCSWPSSMFCVYSQTHVLFCLQPTLILVHVLWHICTVVSQPHLHACMFSTKLMMYSSPNSHAVFSIEPHTVACSSKLTYSFVLDWTRMLLCILNQSHHSCTSFPPIVNTTESGFYFGCDKYSLKQECEKTSGLSYS